MGRKAVSLVRVPYAQRPILLAACLCAPCLAGCGVERTLRVESSPPGALVYLNGEEVARTPAEVPLRWYGKYDVAVRLDGYETLKTQRWVVAPWWQWPPIDLAAELLPIRLHDRRELEFTLKPAEPQDQGLLDRAEAQRAALGTR